MPKKLILFLVVAPLITAVPAFAQTISQTQVFSGILNTSGFLTFNQFDTADGTRTLQFIDVSLALQTSDAQVKFDNNGALPASGICVFGAVGTISSSDVILLNSAFQPVPGQLNALQSNAFSLAADTGDGIAVFDSTSPDGTEFNISILNDTKLDSIAQTVWGFGAKGFSGTGTYNINYSINQWLNLNSIGGIQYAVSPVNISGDMTVVYTFSDPVPEPATICILGFGVLSFIRRRKLA